MYVITLLECLLFPVGVIAYDSQSLFLNVIFTRCSSWVALVILSCSHKPLYCHRTPLTLNGGWSSSVSMIRKNSTQGPLNGVSKEVGRMKAFG